MLSTKTKNMLREMSATESTGFLVASGAFTSRLEAHSLVVGERLYHEAAKMRIYYNGPVASPFRVALSDEMVKYLKTLNPINAIKLLRDLENLSLKAAKDVIVFNQLHRPVEPFVAQPAPVVVKTNHLAYLVYSIECTLANFEHFCSLKKQPAGELNRHQVIIEKVFSQEIFDDCRAVLKSGKNLSHLGVVGRIEEILAYSDNAYEAVHRYFNKTRYQV